MWQRFSEASRQVILNGQGFAMEMGHASTDSGHLFLGVIKDLDDNSRIAALLKLSGVQLEEARLYARSSVADTPTGSDEPKLTASARRVMEYAADEAKRDHSEFIEVEHFFIGCVRTQGGPHVGKVLRPLGLDAEKLRELLREMDSGRVHATGSLLNDLDRASKEAIQAAHDAMRGSFCGRISTAHLLLGLLAIEDKFVSETLYAAKVDPGELKDSARAQIVNDGQIATPQKKFTAAAKRALERSRVESKRCGGPLIRPQHLLLALLPYPASVQEKISFGTSIDDPLEKVWQSLPVQEIQRHYEELRAVQPESSGGARAGSTTGKDRPLKLENGLVGFANFLMGAGWIAIVRAERTPNWNLFALGGLLLLGSASGACISMLFSRSRRTKNVWLSCFLGYILGLMAGVFLSKID